MVSHYILYINKHTNTPQVYSKPEICGTLEQNIFKSSKIKIITSLCLILISINNTIYGQKNDTLFIKKNPTHIQLQYAGNLGLMSVGVGKSFFSERLSLTAIYGYLPKSVNNVTVHTVALRTSYQVAKLSFHPNFNHGIYTGINFMYALTDNTFLKLPAYYPDEYYQPTALHATLFMGAKHNIKINKWNWTNLVSFFTEIGTIDYKIYYAFKTSYIKFSDLWNFSAGMTVKLSR